MTKIIAEPGYYEIHVRPFKEGDVAKKYWGVGGLFETRKNVFRSFDSCINYLKKRRFDDMVCVHRAFENELESRFNELFGFPEDEKIQWSEDGEWCSFYVC